MPTQTADLKGKERPEHEQVAVGEVDQLDDPVDHRVAEGDEGVERPGDQPDAGRTAAEFGQRAISARCAVSDRVESGSARERLRRPDESPRHLLR